MNASRPSVRPTLDCWDCGAPVMKAQTHTHEGRRGGQRRCVDPSCEEWTFKLGVVRRCKGCGVFWHAAPADYDGTLCVELQKLRPVRIDADPNVARAAWRYPSRSKPGQWHTVSLMVGHDQGVESWWECSCGGFAYRDRCVHVEHARLVWAAEEKRA